MIGWTATHTGLPSLSAVGPCTVRSGERVVAIVAAGETRLFSDPLAVVGENRYTDGVDEIVVLRADDGHVFTGVDGRTVARIALLGDDPVDHDSGVAFFGNTDAVRWPIRTPKLTGTLTARTQGVDTDAMRLLARARMKAVSVHSVRECQIPGCDIPPVRALVVTGASEKRDGVVTAARREWSIGWREASADSFSPAPVVTWGEYAANSAGFTAETYQQICRRIAGMP